MMSVTKAVQKARRNLARMSAEYDRTQQAAMKASEGFERRKRGQIGAQHFRDLAGKSLFLFVVGLLSVAVIVSSTAHWAGLIA